LGQDCAGGWVKDDVSQDGLEVAVGDLVTNVIEDDIGYGAFVGVLEDVEDGGGREEVADALD
jgi:hypothetical protein